MWNPDEADHATAARELLLENRWAIPTIAGETFAEKPPLQVWGIVISAKLRGTEVDEFDARVPSAIGNVMIILAAFLLGKRSGGIRTGTLAALVAATCGEVLLRVRWCQVDSLFSGFFALAAVGAHSFITNIKGANPKFIIALATGAALGGAILTKGPLAPALLVAIVAADIVMTREHRRAWFGRAGVWLCVAFAVAAAVALPWYLVLASQDSGGFGRSFIYENIQRFSKSQDHHNPFYYYIAETVWTVFAPASLLFIPAFFFAFETTGKTSAARVFVRDSSPVRFSLASIAGGVLLLSAASSKQGKYLLPLAPFFAVVVADFARHVDAFGKKWQRIWITVVLSIIALVFVIIALLALAASWFGPRADDAFASLIAAFGVDNAPVFPIITVLWPLLFAGFGSFALLAAGIHTRASFRLAWLLGPLTLAILFIGAFTLPELNISKSPKEVVNLAMQRLAELEAAGKSPRYAVYFPDRPPEKPVDSWTGTSPFVYYAGTAYRRPLVLRGRAALEAALSDLRPLILVVRADYHTRLPKPLKDKLLVRFQKPVGSRKLAVLESTP
ncbi:MAG: ArnT family glycosyltransferase [Planctomycetota bacterium]